jgi:hypothetical protein
MKAVEFDRVHDRYWRDQRGNPRADIPVRGGDLFERDGQTYSVLFDCDQRLVAAYRLAGERLMRTTLGAAAIAAARPRGAETGNGRRSSLFGGAGAAGDARQPHGGQKYRPTGASH